MQGRLITFEGIDGAGKSTHIEACVDALRARGHTVVATREPGGTPLAERLRDLLLSEPMSMTAELLLMNAARCDHVEKVVRPALEKGQWVVCDRFVDATWAYQGGGRDADTGRIAWLEDWVTGGLRPDRTFLFDLAPAKAAERRARSRGADRFEREDERFFEKVRDAYLARAAAEPTRFVVLDSQERVAQVRQRLLDALEVLDPRGAVSS